MEWRSPAGRYIVYYVWEFKLTQPGKYLVACGIAASIFAAGSLEVPVYNLLTTLFMLGLLALVVNMLHRPRLRLSCTFPGKVSAGQEAKGEVIIRNTEWQRAYDLSARFFQLPTSLRAVDHGEHVADLPRGASVMLPVCVKTLRRGLYDLPPLRVFSTFPFNLLRSGSRKVQVPPLLVLPRFHAVEAIDVPVSRRYQPGGVALTSNIGESPEFIGNREFRMGDSIRRIDTRAWARLAKPIVREYQEEYFCRLALVVDTYVPRTRRSRPEGFPELEAAISLAATVTDALSRGEYLIDIFAAGPELYRFRTGRSTAHFENVLEILASIDACRTNPFDTVAPALADELPAVSTLVCIFLDWDSSRRDLVRMARELGCKVKVLIVRDGAATEAIDPAEADALDVFETEVIRTGGFSRL